MLLPLLQGETVLWGSLDAARILHFGHRRAFRLWFEHPQIGVVKRSENWAAAKNLTHDNVGSLIASPTYGTVHT
jgi:hypothetical protein